MKLAQSSKHKVSMICSIHYEMKSDFLSFTLQHKLLQYKLHCEAKNCTILFLQ